MTVAPKRLRRRGLLRAVEVFFWCMAAIFLGAYAFVYLDRTAFQAYQTWAFDRRLEKQPAPVVGFLLHSLRLQQARSNSPDADPGFTKPVPDPKRPALPPGSLIGRLEIPKVGVRAMIVNGTTETILRRAVGHIEGTGMPGEPGNVGLAGHRDTFFLGLRNIHKGDAIVIRTLEGAYEYTVDSIRIVGPDDVEVLAASSTPTLTLVTCYPFDYVGAAPRRFIVRAHEVAGPGTKPQQPRGS